jgi:hypothetical protein
VRACRTADEGRVTARHNSFLDPEARLLLACAREEEAAAEVRDLVAGPLNWQLFAELVQGERAATTVHAVLAKCASDLVPDDLLAAVRHMARVEAFRMAYLNRRLVESVTALAELRIPCVLLKGAALATGVYKRFSDRPMIDIDLLVPESRGRDALTQLLKTGWTWADVRDEGADFSRLHHFPALADGRGMPLSLELHTGILPHRQPFGLTPQLVFEEATAAARGIPALMPSPAHMLLHICVHFAWAHMLRKHGWRAFRDVRAITERTRIDWDEFLALAGAMRARTCCYWTFRLARDLVGPVVPAEVLDALRPSVPEAMLRAVARHSALVLFPTGADCPSARVRRWFWSAAVRPRRSGHGASRPWRKEILLEPSGVKWGFTRHTDDRSGPERLHGWMRYGRGVLLGMQ